MESSRKRRMYIFCQPRTCSMLFQRLLSEHPQLGQIFHPFSAAAMYGPERLQLSLKRCDAADEVQRDWGSNFPDMNSTTFGSSENALMGKLSDIEEEGRIICVKDHLACIVKPELIRSDHQAEVFENPTRLPNDFMRTITHPILLIRHPILMVRSFWEAQLPVYKMQPGDDLFTAMTTLRWTSHLCDWFMKNGIDPIVIDGYDIVHSTTSVMENVCASVGIDPKGVVYEWPAEGKVDFADNQMRRVFMGKLQQSTEVRQDLGGASGDDVSLEEQVEHWRSKWGEEVAEKLRMRVEEGMPLYRRLRAVAMRSSGDW